MYLPQSKGMSATGFSGSTGTKHRIRLVSAFWGEAFADTFLRVGLRSLMAEGNILDLAHESDVVYTIYTTKDAAQKLEAAPLFQALRLAVDVRLRPFALTEIDASNFGSHNIFWKRAIEIAQRNRQILFFIIPDVVYAKGTLTRWAARFAEGARVLYTPGPQVVMETFLPLLEDRFPPGLGPIALDADEIPALIFQHFHPIHSLMRPGRRYQPAHPEADFRIVPGHGIVWREFTAHPHAFDPAFFTKIESFNPCDHLDRMHFERCSLISIEPILKRSYQYYRPRGQDEHRITNMGHWHHHYAGEAGLRLSANAFEMSELKDADWDSGRRRARGEGRQYRAHLVMASRLFALFEGLRSRPNLTKAAQALAVGNFLCRLRRRILVHRNAFILAPVDAALNPALESEVLSLLRPGRREALFALIANHVVIPPDDVAGSGSSGLFTSNDLSAYRTASGLAIAPLIAGVKLVGEPFDAGIFTVYPINRVLRPVGAPSGIGKPRLRMVSGSVLTDASRENMARKSSNNLPSLDGTWRPYRGTYVVTEWGRRSRLHRVIFAALHIPFVEPLVTLFFPVYFKPEIKSAFNFFVRCGRAAVRICASVLRAVGSRFLRPGSLSRRMLGAIKRRVLVGWPPSRRAAAAKVAAVPKAAPAPVIPEVSLQPDHITLLDEIRLARVLESLTKLLSEFEQAYDARRPHAAPFELVREVLEREGMTGERGRTATESALMELASIYPNCAEVWLELAFLRQDQGQPEQAIDCFRRASEGKPFQEVGPFFHDPRGIASSHLAELLFELGRQGEGFQACARIVETERETPFTMTGLKFALELCKTGNGGRAWPHFSRAMTFEEYRWRVPNIRDLRAIDFSRLAKYVDLHVRAHQGARNLNRGHHDVRLTNLPDP